MNPKNLIVDLALSPCNDSYKKVRNYLVSEVKPPNDRLLTFPTVFSFFTKWASVDFVAVRSVFAGCHAFLLMEDVL